MALEETAGSSKASGAMAAHALSPLVESALDEFLGLALAHLGAQTGSIMLLDPTTGLLSITAARGLDKQIVERIRVSFGQPIAGLVAARAAPLLVGEGTPPQALGGIRFPLRHDVHSALCIPIADRRGILGVLNLNRTSPTAQFSAADMQSGVFLSSVAALLIELATIAVQGELAFRQLNRYRMELINTREDERRRIARELHDNALQSLAELTWQLAAAKKLMHIDPDKVADELRTATRGLRATIKEIREVCMDLRPTILEEGLQPALQSFIAAFARRTGTKATLLWERKQKALPPEVESSIFRIIQEALNNVRKHARARRVSVRVKATDTQIHVTVHDDGVGFNLEMLPKASSRGLGLSNIRERAKLLGGELLLTTAPDEGTRLSVKIPTRSADGSDASTSRSEADPAGRP